MIKLQTVNDQIDFYEQSSKVNIPYKINHNNVWQAMLEVFHNFPTYNTSNMLLFVAHDRLVEFLTIPTHNLTEYKNKIIDEFGRFGRIHGVNCITDKGGLVKYIDGVKLVYTAEEIHNWWN